ncbi:MAG: SMC-Scp complex subunit ScpB [Bacteroidia bacterium]|jgi:segregation and condensation protein B|nr:SMC-Scp complex subunit ScpB [Bacteroidota bacterium]MBP7245174.1 SMC-Scp complex subunit ScpB [Bacteroidia bacterium]
MQLLLQHIEALIFASEQPITGDEVLSCLKTVYGWELKKEQFQSLISELKEKYASEDHSFELIEIADGFQFLTKKEYHHVVNTLLQIKAKKRLSTAALETLSIIAYKQPISKSEIEHIRGVNCDYSIQKLLEKELIIISGKGDGPGKPLLYSTSKNFMDHFGLRSVKDLPQLKELHIADNEIGNPSDLSDPIDVPVDLEPGALIEEVDENGEFVVEGSVDPQAAMGNLEQDLIDDEDQPESKEE